MICYQDQQLTTFDKEFGTDLMTTMKKEGVDVRCGTKVMGYLVDTEGGKKWSVELL